MRFSSACVCVALLASSPQRARAEGRHFGLPRAAQAADPRAHFVVPEPPPQVPEALLAKLQFVELGLTRAKKRDDAHVLMGSLQVGAGAIFAGAAVLAEDPAVRTLLGSAAALSIARGVVTASMRIGSAEAPLRMSVLDVQAALTRKLAHDERALVHAARRSRRERILQGSITMLGAVSYVPLAWWLSERATPAQRFGDRSVDYVGLSLSVIAFASGLVEALRESPLEKHLRSYRQMPR